MTASVCLCVHCKLNCVLHFEISNLLLNFAFFRINLFFNAHQAPYIKRDFFLNSVWSWVLSIQCPSTDLTWWKKYRNSIVVAKSDRTKYQAFLPGLIHPISICNVYCQTYFRLSAEHRFCMELLLFLRNKKRENTALCEKNYID